MRYGFRVREEEQPMLFTSNKEVLFPKIQSLAKKQQESEGNLQKYTFLMVRLLNILEELEILITEKNLRYKYILDNGEELETSDYSTFNVLRMIGRYSEALDEESTARLYQELENIENSYLINNIYYNKLIHYNWS